jgi:methionyl-tRNA synthetase
MADLETVLENHRINVFERLFERVDRSEVNAMVEESREAHTDNAGRAGPAEPIKPECTIEDFGKIDLRIAKVVKAEPVEGADKLLRLQLDVGGLQKTCLAAVTQAYEPEELTGKIVIYLANLRPRQMRFGLSEGMILAAGTGGKDIFMLSADPGAKPGQRVL